MEGNGFTEASFGVAAGMAATEATGGSGALVAFLVIMSEVIGFAF